MVKQYWMALILLMSSLLLLGNPTTEKKFVIVITSYNNADWFEKNLSTLFTQLNEEGTDFYAHYRIIYIDDCSTDGTAELVEKYIYDCNQQHRVVLIKNKVRKRALANLYYALQLCEPDEIVFNYDGDDWLAHDNVFALINAIYQDPNIWITYGQFQNWPTNEMGYCQPLSAEILQKQNFRKKWWMPGQLRTFYAWLFHQVHLKDLLFEGPYFQGQFFPANSDLAIYYPMMEMAGPTHYYFIPDVIYIRNVATPINDFKANKEVQILGSKLIREKTKYAPLSYSMIDYFEQYRNKKADLIIFSTDEQRSQRLIISARKLARNLGEVKIIQEHSSDFKEQLFDALRALPSDYVLFLSDAAVFSRYLDCADAIYALEKSFAYGFFLGLDHEKIYSYQSGITQPMPALNRITDSVYAWAFHYADSGDWRCCHNLGGTVYRKAMVIDALQNLNFNSVHELFAAWKTVAIPLEEVGLCYEQAKINYVTWY